jgi:ferric-dicitrate binding protein FerR (iron transport regulator)
MEHRQTAAMRRALRTSRAASESGAAFEEPPMNHQHATHRRWRRRLVCTAIALIAAAGVTTALADVHIYLKFGNVKAGKVGSVKTGSGQMTIVCNGWGVLRRQRFV